MLHPITKLKFDFSRTNNGMRPRPRLRPGSRDGLPLPFCETSPRLAYHHREIGTASGQLSRRAKRRPQCVNTVLKGTHHSQVILGLDMESPMRSRLSFQKGVQISQMMRTVICQVTALPASPPRGGSERATRHPHWRGEATGEMTGFEKVRQRARDWTTSPGMTTVLQ